MKLLMFPIRLILLILLAVVIIIFSLITIPVTIVKGIFRRNIIEEFNDWYEVFTYIFEWMWRCLI